MEADGFLWRVTLRYVHSSCGYQSSIVLGRINLSDNANCIDNLQLIKLSCLLKVFNLVRSVVIEIKYVINPPCVVGS